MKLGMDWEIGWSNCEGVAPNKWVPATVPGAVQLDWARAEGWGDHFYGDNWRQYGWMEDKFWTYRTRLKKPAMQNGEKLYLVSQGIDYSFRIRLDDVELWRQEGMFTPVELDLTDQIQVDSELIIELDPAPKRPDAPVGRDQADRSCKPAVSYGWDWHPRLIPLGIWDDTYLTVRPAVHIASAETSYELNETLDEAVLIQHVVLSQPSEGRISWKVVDPEGAMVIDAQADISGSVHTFQAMVERPGMWWPHDHGEQPLYTSKVVFHPAGSGASTKPSEQRIGFRRVRLVMHEDAWKEPSQFPKSRSNPPVTMEINGRVIFCKGTNWVNPDIFPGRITAEDYRVLLDMAKDANMNLLRIWGGGIVNKTSFYELCDELGLMVWQEFPLACNQYPDTSDYLKVLDQESCSIITRLRKHPSVVLWCGGNELFNAWSRMTDQSLPLRLLNANCYRLDPQTPFLMTSPVEGMGHGHYMFQYRNGEDVLQSMPKARNTAYTEFGVPSPSSVEQLACFIPPDELYPPKPGTAWESHHAFKALSDNMWLMADQIEHYFGPWTSLEQLVEYGQTLQSEGYKCIYEEARRQKPVCAMALNWCYNEPWPTAANNSIVMWPAKPKPAYYAVQASCRPVLASARLPKFLWTEGEWFEPELWMLSDSPLPVPSGRIEAWLTVGEGKREHLLTWDYGELAPNRNLRGPTIRFRLPSAYTGRMKLELLVPEQPEWSSFYTLSYRGQERSQTSDRSLLNFGTA